MQSLTLLLVVIAIYAIIGVNLYEKDDPEHFRNFAHSAFTLAGIATGHLFVHASPKQTRQSNMQKRVTYHRLQVTRGRE